MVFPPSPYAVLARQSFDEWVEVGVQNVYTEKSGAFTGELSVDFCADLGLGNGTNDLFMITWL